MREIKFRGKRLDNDEWVYGYLVNISNRSWIKDINNNISLIRLAPDYADIRCAEIDIKTVGQYTGLKDNNGVEIYEGDICRCLDSYGENYYISDINYNGGAFSVEVGGCNYDYTALGWALENNDINEIEVIGNIYEHPELITQKEGEV